MKANRTFDSGTSLPVGIVRIKTAEYVKSAFDRGHVCPHSDRAADEEVSYSTFMSNIIPMASNVNRKAWAHVEDYTRDLAKLGNCLHRRRRTGRRRHRIERSGH